MSLKQDICAQYIENIFPFLSIVYTQGEPAVQPASSRLLATSLYAEILQLEKEMLV